VRRLGTSYQPNSVGFARRGLWFYTEGGFVALRRETVPIGLLLMEPLSVPFERLPKKTACRRRLGCFTFYRPSSEADASRVNALATTRKKPRWPGLGICGTVGHSINAQWSGE
jgi:hypothetical protein